MSVRDKEIPHVIKLSNAAYQALEREAAKPVTSAERDGVLRAQALRKDLASGWPQHKR